MDPATAYRKLTAATATLQEKMQELGSFADEFVGGTHRVAPRVELDRYAQLCSEIESAIEEHNQARETFLRVLRGDVD